MGCWDCIQFGLTVLLSSMSWWNWVLMSLFNLMKWIDTFKSNFEFLKIMFQFILCFNLSFVANNRHQKINEYKQKHQETISINKHWYKYSLRICRGNYIKRQHSFSQVEGFRSKSCFGNFFNHMRYLIFSVGTKT